MNGIISRHSAAAEYLADLVGYELHDQAVGSAVTNASISFRPVGDFYPSNLISNKRGTQNVTLPTFDDQIAGCAPPARRLFRPCLMLLPRLSGSCMHAVGHCAPGTSEVVAGHACMQLRGCLCCMRP